MSILNFKPFYVHQDVQGRSSLHNAHDRSKPRGFTAKVSPSGNERTVLLQVTMCAYKDEFCKREGRANVEYAKTHEINARDLPAYLLQAAYDCKFYKNPEQKQADMEYDKDFYYWVLRYLV